MTRDSGAVGVLPEVVWEGGRGGFVAVVVCGGVQNRPTGTETPSRLG